MEWFFLHSRNRMDHITLHVIVHRYIWLDGLGAPIGLIDGYKPNGYLLNVIETLCGKNFTQLFVLYIPGAASGYAKKSSSTVTALQW